MTSPYAPPGKNHEEITVDLMNRIFQAEGLRASPHLPGVAKPEGTEKVVTRREILDTYAACLRLVRNPDRHLALTEKAEPANG